MTAIIEDAKELVVDKWGTLNTAASPQKLPDGHSPNNQNVWMDEKPGSIVTANGYIKLGEIPSGNPPTFLLNYFKTSDGSSQLIVSDNATIWHTTDYVNYTVIKTGLSQAFQLRGKVIRDKVWFTNGSDDVATWNGTSYVELDGSGSTPDVPTGKYIEYHDERVWIYGVTSDLSSLRFSALTDTSGTEIDPDNANAWPTDNELQISEGDADQGTGIFLYRGFLYCSKQYSFWRIVGYDEYTYTRVKTRSSTGTRFQESIQIKDNLVHFIGVDGFYVFDGEESKRISDIIDPANPDDGVFSFRNLQQPLLNNKFWNVSETSDFDAGTLPRNISSADAKLTLLPVDDSQADFQAGATLTNIDTTSIPGSIALTRKTSGTDHSSEDIARNQTVRHKAYYGTSSVIETPSYLTDDSTSTIFGVAFTNPSPGSQEVFVTVDLNRSILISAVQIFNYQPNVLSTIHVYVNNSTPVDITSMNFAGSGGIPSYFVHQTSHDFTNINTGVGYLFDFSAIQSQQIMLRVVLAHGNGSFYMGSCRVYPTAYEATGEFVSRSIDFGVVPGSFGSLVADSGAISVPNNSTVSFYTQSSSDGSTWDSAVAVTSGGSIGSTLRRYLRWGASFTSTGAETHAVSRVYVGSTYLSEIHDTGGNIIQWGALAIDRNAAGQTVNVYYRAATTSGGVSAASWTAIVPGAVPNTAITNTFIQIRIEISTTNTSQAPSVDGFTVNWIVSAASGAAILQNVASQIIFNRYWLAAATLGADENDIVLALGKETFQSPWHKKDFKVLSFTRFLDIFIAGSSEDGSLYRLEYGHSKNGDAMDSFYETRDFSSDNFQMKGKEILVTADRSGPYDLSVGWSTDGGETYTEKEVDLTREDGDSLSFTKRLNIGYMSDSVRFRVRINAADQPFSVDEIRSYYRPTPQRGEIAA